MADNKQSKLNDTANEWTRAASEQMGRWVSFQESMIEKSREQAQTWLNESARLSREALQYSSQPAAEWMKIGTDAAKRGMDGFTGKAS